MTTTCLGLGSICSFSVSYGTLQFADLSNMHTVSSPYKMNRLAKFQACLRYIRMWMTCNVLLLWTEVIVLGLTRLRNKLLNDIVTLDDISLTSNNAVRTLGIGFDQNLSFDSHLKPISRPAFVHPQKKCKNQILSISKMMLKNWCMTLSLPGLNIIRLYYQVTNDHPTDQNAALFLCCACTCSHSKKETIISPILASLHWLPLKSRIEFKVFLRPKQVLNDQAPLILLSSGDLTLCLRSWPTSPILPRKIYPHPIQGLRGGGCC